MSCERLPDLKQLTVDDPAALLNVGWIRHFSQCDDCRNEHDLAKDTLTIYKQLEQERLTRCPDGPKWEDFCAIVMGETKSSALHRGNFRVHMLAAAVIGAFMVGIAGTWILSGPNIDIGTAVAEHKSEIQESNIDNLQKSGSAEVAKDDVGKQGQDAEGVWGELRINKLGELEVVGNSIGTRFQNKRPTMTLEPIETPRVTPVSNQ